MYNTKSGDVKIVFTNIMNSYKDGTVISIQKGSKVTIISSYIYLDYHLVELSNKTKTLIRDKYLIDIHDSYEER